MIAVIKPSGRDAASVVATHSHFCASRQAVAGVSCFIAISTLFLVAPTLLHSGSLQLFRGQPVANSPVAARIPSDCPGPQPKPRKLDLPWAPLLSREELARGLSYYGSGGRLQALAAKLLAGQPIKSYALGGSVTEGGGATNTSTHGYVARFHQWINASFPHSEHVLVNRAIPASTAFLFATCLQHHVPPDADLVTLEFTVNERRDAPFTSAERRSFEQLVRRLLAYPRRPALVMLHHYAWYDADGDGVDQGLFYREPEASLTTLAQYYDLPVVSVRAAVWRLMAAGLRHFQVGRVMLPDRMHKYLEDGEWVERAIPVAPPSALARAAFFYSDSVHPYNTGHKILAELLVQPFKRAVREVESGEALTDADRRRSCSVQGLDLPPPMIPGNADEQPGVCALLEDFRGVVRDTKGFDYLPERPNATSFVKQKWGWRAETPGSWAELQVDTAQGLKGGRGETVLWLSHLRSYQGMGTAMIECVHGCTCPPTLLDGTWDQRVSLFYMTRFPVTRHQHCRVRVTVSAQPGAFAGQGHKVTLVGVMVTHVPLANAGTLAAVSHIEYNIRR